MAKFSSGYKTKAKKNTALIFWCNLLWRINPTSWRHWPPWGQVIYTPSALSLNISHEMAWSKTQGKVLTPTWLTSKVLALLNLADSLNNIRKGGLFKLQLPRDTSLLEDLEAKSRTPGLSDNLEWEQKRKPLPNSDISRKMHRQREVVPKVHVLTVVVSG